MGRARTGVLLANLGTPASPATADVRRFLREFLSDRAVVDAPRLLWWLVLNGSILPWRARRSAELYASIWTREGSPLLVHAQRQCDLVQAELGDRWLVRCAMRYGEPSFPAAIAELCADGVD